MSSHWKVLIWMLAGLVVGLVMQWTLEAQAWAGLEFKAHGQGLEVTAVAKGSPAAKAKLQPGQVFASVLLERGSEDEVRVVLAQPADWTGLASDGAESAELDPESVLGRSSNGEVLWLVPPATGEGEPELKAVAVAVTMDPDSPRAVVLTPFVFAGDIFLALLKMLIVPLVLASIVTGVAGVGAMKDLRRLGGKTLLYYVSTSLLAILVGQFLVNTIRPGSGATLGLSPAEAVGAGAGTDDSFIGVIKRAVPQNVFEAFSDNSSMLSIIFFALLLGYFITRAGEHGARVREVFESFFEVMMKMAEGVLSLLPYGVFALIVKVTAATGFSPFKSLLLYMFTVALALVLHAGVTLPLILRFVGGLSPRRWAQAMSPALMTAFSTSSSSMTLPVTLKTVEQRGRVSNKVTSFTLPLGATINMDGTALYECIGVVFLAQYYASVGDFSLTFGDQAFIVILALLASIGAAGIPSAGLVMMLTILSALKLPTEGAALLLAVDRPLDMMRTMVNVWSDSCGAAVIARTEGEEGPLAPITGNAGG
jgi:Na+/H+-dicarboxylate symporter